MLRFHEARQTGLSSAAALASAQSGLSARGRHPWFWAGFSVWTRSLS
jgi:CHAT domain-containing protein